MSISLFDRLTNFIMPPPKNKSSQNNVTALSKHNRDRKGGDSEVLDIKPFLKVHSQQPAGSLKISIEYPVCFDDVQKYADYLKSGTVVMVNYQNIPLDIQEKMCDFLNGTCYILGGSVQRVSEQVVLYAHSAVELDKKFFSYSVPTYVRAKADK